MNTTIAGGGGENGDDDVDDGGGGHIGNTNEHSNGIMMKNIEKIDESYPTTIQELEQKTMQHSKSMEKMKTSSSSNQLNCYFTTTEVLVPKANKPESEFSVPYNIINNYFSVGVVSTYNVYISHKSYKKH
jgi:hypothetical protein